MLVIFKPLGSATVFCPFPVFLRVLVQCSTYLKAFICETDYFVDLNIPIKVNQEYPYLNKLD